MRILAIFVLGFAMGTLACQYLLPLEWMLLAAGVGTLSGLLGLLWKGSMRRRAMLFAAGLALSMLYNFIYVSYVRQGVERYAEQEQTIALEVLDYAEATSTRARILVRIPDAGFLRDRAVYYGDESLYELQPGDTVTGLIRFTDASRINETDLTAFTARGRYLLAFSDGEVAYTHCADRSLATLPQRLAHKMSTTVETVFSEESAEFLKALLLGDRTGMSVEQESDLGEVGLYHITAVSGMHFGFLFMLLAFVVGKHRPRCLAAVTVPVLLLYMLLVGCSASVVRACVMLLFVLIGPLLGRESDPMTSLSAALLVLLLANPYAVAGVGLQLSFASMMGLLVLAPRIYEILPKRGRWIRGTLASSLGVMACTAPLCAFYFNCIPLVSPLANILAGPVATVTFVAGLLITLLGMIVPPLASVLALLPEMGVLYIETICRALAQIPYHAIYFNNPYLRYWLAYVLVMFGYCAVTPKARRKYYVAAGLSAVMLVLVLMLPVQQRYGKLHVVAVDVGQGASTILSSDGAAAVVDCGSKNSYIDAGDRAADALNTYGYYHLDYLVLTHYHADHANGVATLLARLPVDTILAPPPEAAEDTALYKQLLSLAERYDVAVVLVEKDSTYSLGEASLQIFAPVGEGGTNEEGLSVVGTAGDFDVLITGDMSDKNEEILVSTKRLPDIEVLMVGHHGSKYATSTALLYATRPEIGIISVGSNSYGHPTDETLRRIAGFGMELYRTDRQGNISIVLS